MKFQKKLAILSKKFNSKFVYNKKYLQIKKKEGFQCFYAPVLLIDSIYWKNGKYYPKVFLENYNFIDYIEIWINYTAMILMKKLK